MAAQIQVRDSGGTLRTITGISVRDSGAVLRTVTDVRVRDSGAVLRQVFSTGSALSASASPDVVSGTTSGTGTAVSNATAVTPSGGTGPYTYAWTRTSYNHPSVAPTIGSPSAATTTFTQTSIGTGEDYGATFRCTVTDSLGATATADVSAIWADTA